MIQSLKHYIKLSTLIFLVCFSSLSSATPNEKTLVESQLFIHNVGVHSYMNEQLEVLWARHSTRATSNQYHSKSAFKQHLLNHQDLPVATAEACLSYFTYSEMKEINQAFHQAKNEAEFMNFLRTPLGQKLIYNQPKLKRKCAEQMSIISNI